MNFLSASPKNREVLFPYLTGDELVGNIDSLPKRYVIDFQPRDILHARAFTDLFRRVEKLVLPDREEAASKEQARNEEALKANPNARVNRHHKNFLSKWWLLSYPRQEMIDKLNTLPRYIACSRVTKRQTFEFVCSSIHPNDKLQVFALSDDYSFGIISSGIHWQWLITKGTTLKGDYNYNTESVWDTFPWPQSPTLKQVQDVAKAAVSLRQLRHKVMKENSWTLRELYRTLELLGENPLKDAHDALDNAVRTAYGMKSKSNVLEFLLNLNFELADKEAEGKGVTGPGLPPIVSNPKQFITADCVRMS